MKKVYILKIDVAVDNEDYSETRVFDEYDKAKEAFDHEVAAVENLTDQDWDVDSYDELFDATHIFLPSNHIYIEIIAKDVL